MQDIFLPLCSLFNLIKRNVFKFKFKFHLLFLKAFSTATLNVYKQSFLLHVRVSSLNVLILKQKRLQRTQNQKHLKSTQTLFQLNDMFVFLRHSCDIKTE